VTTSLPRNSNTFPSKSFSISISPPKESRVRLARDLWLGSWSRGGVEWRLRPCCWFDLRSAENPIRQVIHHLARCILKNDFIVLSFFTILLFLDFFVRVPLYLMATPWHTCCRYVRGYAKGTEPLAGAVQCMDSLNNASSLSPRHLLASVVVPELRQWHRSSRQQQHMALHLFTVSVQTSDGEFNAFFWESEFSIFAYW
jgi:hypothetical protein